MIWSSVVYGFAASPAPRLFSIRPGQITIAMRFTSSSNDDFEKAIEDAIAGNPDAFARIFNEYRRYVLRVVSSLRCGHEEDVAGDVWRRIAENIRKLENRGASAFRVWVWRIARNLAAEHATRCDSANILQLLDEPASGISFEEQLLLRDVLEKASEQLTPSYREAFDLSFVQELDNTEIANRLGISVQHAAVRIFRAKKKMISILRNRQTGAER